MSRHSHFPPGGISLSWQHGIAVLFNPECESAVRSSDYLNGKLLADTWCAAFVWPKNSLYDYPITEEVFRRIERNLNGCERAMRDPIEHIAGEYRFLHWHLAFPDVFRAPQSDSEPNNERTGAMRPDGSLDSELPRIPAAKLDNPDYTVQPRYWVPEWEVIKASSRVPPGLARAVEEESEDRAYQIAGLWLAGYALNRDRFEETYQLIVVEGKVHSFASMSKMTCDWDAAKKLERQFCLQEYEVGELNGFGSFLEAAEHLVRTRVPRWLLGFRRIARATDERTGLFSALPTEGMGDSVFLMFVGPASPAETF